MTSPPPTADASTVNNNDNNNNDNNDNLTGGVGGGSDRWPPLEPHYPSESYVAALHRVVVPVLFSVIVVLGVGGNSLVVYVIVSRERMRTVTNILLLNLGMADLLFVLFVPSFTAYQFATTSWPFGNAVCKLLHYIVNVTAYVTVYTLVLISAVRYMTIVHGISTARLRTTTNTVCVVAALWVVALVVTVPVLGAYGVVLGEHGLPECQTHGIQTGRELFGTFFAFAYLLPLAVIAVLSVCIVRHLTKQRSEILERRTRSSNKKRRAGLLLILVVVAFAVLWLPIHVHLLLAFYVHLPYNHATLAAGVACHCLAYCNSCINPFIYNCTSKDFRDAFRDVVVCYCCSSSSSPGRMSSANGEEEERGQAVVGANAAKRQTTSNVTETIQLCDVVVVNGDAA